MNEDEFKKLTDEEKEKKFIYVDTMFTIARYLGKKDDTFIVEFIEKTDLTHINASSILELLSSLKNKNLLCKLIDKIPVHVIQHYRFVYVFEDIDGDLYKMIILNYILHMDKKNIDLKYFVKTLDEDKNKTKYFEFLSISDQVYLIKSFTDLELKKEYVLKPEYSNYRSELVASVEDEQFILDMFDKIDVKKFRFNLIKRIDNLIIKEKLIYKLGNKSLIEFIKSFDLEQESVEIDDAIDPKITIGVELETCHKDIEALKVLKEMPHGFKITRDGSVRHGFEIVSPILHHTKEDMNNLSDICKILKENSFYTDSTCGGHIHLGADYLESIDEYKMFLHLYCNFEDIIYLICNRMNTKSRHSVHNYAAKTKSQYLKASKKGFFEGDYESLDEFKEKIIELNDSRYKGLNVYNLKKFGKNTLEFRMANGEIDYNELYYNIKLYAKLLQVSKELANIKPGDPRLEYLNLLSVPLNEKEKLSILLGLLFQDEKDRNFYKKRYEKNIDIIHAIFNSIRKKDAITIVNPKILVLNK